MAPRSHIGVDQFDALGMLDVRGRVSQLRLNHAFKIIYDNSGPEYLFHQLTKVSSVTVPNREVDINFHQPTVKREVDNTFYTNANMDWNNPPASIKTDITKRCLNKPYLSSTLKGFYFRY